MAGWGYGGLGIRFGEDFHVGYSKYNQARDITFDGSWHHIVSTVDFTSRRDNVRIYLDGKLVAKSDGAALAPFNRADKKSRVYIGARQNGEHAFPGALDDVSVYDYPLSQEQIVEIYHGPVFSGAPIETYLPDRAHLRGIAPTGTTVSWSSRPHRLTG